MVKPLYNKKHKEVPDSFLLNMPMIVPGKMFGYPAYYVGEKLFACLYGKGVGVKVPENLANSLIGKDGVIGFQPMGKAKMREWIQTNRKQSADYLDDEDILKASIRFVSSLAETKKRRP
jgi:hypothetical protein